MLKRKKPTPRVVSTKAVEMAGSQPDLSAKIGGVGNTPKDATKNYPKGK